MTPSSVLAASGVALSISTLRALPWQRREVLENVLILCAARELEEVCDTGDRVLLCSLVSRACNVGKEQRVEPTRY